MTDEIQSSRRPSLETITLTAGLHRQTWISGYPLFVDIKISNQGTKTVKKVELQLERSLFVYANAAPSVELGLEDTLRLPDQYQKVVVSKGIAERWQVHAQSQELRTCSLPVPTGLISIDTGELLYLRSSVLT